MGSVTRTHPRSNSASLQPGEVDDLRILQGDWSAYRCRKMQTSRKRGWWAKMVELQGEEEITEKAKLHLASKLCGPDPQAWDDELERVLEDIVISEPWTPFVIEDLHAELGRLAGCGVSRETKYLVRQLKSNYLVGKVPGGGEVTIHCSTGIKQGAPESAELFGLILESALSELLSGKKWGDLGHSVPDLPMDLLMYQDDIFLWDTTAETLQTRLRLVNARLLDLGLQLATSKTCVVSTPEYRGSRTIKVSGETIPIQSASTPLKVLGLNFLFDGDQGRQAKELIARVRAAFGAHRELLRGRSSWENKVFAVRTLLESTFTWVAGAVYWHHDDLGAMNTLQIHILRDAFRLNRKTGKLWHEWNQRTMRFVRAWLHQTGLDRWSTRTRKLQHGLAGHWARQVEDDGRGIEPTPGVTARFLIWRNLEWWRR
ncbi:unnamed protein product [Symbiodinium sp. CCMP2456]|nr:unnamed protein product [Symbiodinium sp. CCMP2456]